MGNLNSAFTWRDFVTPGISGSGLHDPSKAEIRNTVGTLERLIIAGSLGDLWFATQAELYADLDHDAGKAAVVYDDDDPKNGFYIKSGVSGSGSWVQQTEFLPGYQFIFANDDGNSDGEAYTLNATPASPSTDGSTIVSFVVPITNTILNPTVSFNGGASYPILTASGSDVAIGGLTGNTPVFGIVYNGSFYLRSDQASSAIVEAAQAAALQAESAAELIFSSISELLASDITYTDGSSRTVSDGVVIVAGPYRFVVVASDAIYYASNGYHISTNDGVRLQALPNESGWIHFAQFGGVFNDRNAAANNGVILGEGGAVEWCKNNEYGLDLGIGNIFNSEPMIWPVGSRVRGAGNSLWHWVPGATQEPSPTQIIMVGTGSKDETIHGISAMGVSGAVYTNPDSRPATHNDSEYRMVSFMDSSSSQAGRTKRAFSAALHLVGGILNGKSNIEGFRIVTDYGGADGLDGYSANTDPSDDWAAEWDIGLYVNGGAGQYFHDLQIAGHWRMAGRLVLSARNGRKSLYDNYGWQNPYWTTFDHCLFDGFVSTAIRASDTHKIRAITSSTVEIVWDDDHPYGTGLNEYGDKISLGTHFFSVTDFDVTLYEKVNVASEDRLRMTLSTDPVAAGFAVGDALHPYDLGTGGSSHVHDIDCQYRQICHPSNLVCHNKSLTDPFTHPAALFNMSGHRQVEFISERGSAQSRDEVGLHLHDFWTIRFDASQFERNPSSEEAIPAETAYRMIAAPWHENATNVATTQSAGTTRQLMIDSQAVLFSRMVDFRPMYPLERSGRFTSEHDFFQPDLGTIPELATDFGGSQGNALRAPVDGKVGMRDSSYWDEAAPDDRELGWAMFYNDETGNFVFGAQNDDDRAAFYFGVPGAAEDKHGVEIRSFKPFLSLHDSSDSQSSYQLRVDSGLLRMNFATSAEADSSNVYPNTILTIANYTIRPETDGIVTLGTNGFRGKEVNSELIRSADGIQVGAGNSGPVWNSGAGSPEGAVTAVVGSMYTRTNGGSGTTLYVKETGSGNTGWVAK